MRHYPDADNKYDQEDLAELNAQPWMVRLLKLNPDYTCWGPHEDYMSDSGDGWNSRQLPNTWSEFGPWELDDLNELANFYFSVERDSKECPSCGGSGYHPDALWVSGSFYENWEIIDVIDPFADNIDISWPTANAFDGMSCVGEMTVHRVDIHAHGIFIYGFEKIGERLIAMEWFARTVPVPEKDNHVQSI